jgi:hypothetical protein
MVKLFAPLWLLVVLFLVISAAGATSASLSVSPAGQTVVGGAALSIRLMQHSDQTTTGVQTDFGFDPSLLQIKSVELGAAYAGASLLMGVAPQTPAEVISEANTTGLLKNVSAFFLPGLGNVPPGEGEFVVLTMEAKPGVSGTSPITLANSEMLDDQGNGLAVSATNGEVIVEGPGGTPTPTPVPGGLIQGDVDCSGSVNSVDSLKILRFVAQLSVAKGPGCPEIGNQVASLFGDVDCSGGVNSVDSLKLLRYVASLSVSQSNSCPAIGSSLG